MGQIISIAVSSAYEIYNSRRRPLEIENEPMEDVNVQAEDWAWKQKYDDNALKNELNKLKRLISNNLVKTKDLNYARAIKGIKNENLNENNYASYLFPSVPIWYGPYETVELYIERQKKTFDFDTLMSYSFNKTNDFYLVRFTDDSNKLNINLIRQMYHCIELALVEKGGHIDLEADNGREIKFFHPFNQNQIKIKISTLRSMYGYYNSKRNSFYIQDRLIIGELMQLIKLMNFDKDIVGYYYNDNVFHTEFTILAGKQHEVLLKPKIINSAISKNGTRLWSLGGGVKLYNLLQEPRLHTFTKPSTFTKHTKSRLHTKHTFTLQEPTKPEIANNDEFIQIMQEFFNYQYQCELFDIPDSELSNIRIKQLELKQKALLLIEDKKVYNFADNFLDCYTISPISGLDINGGLGIKSKKRRIKVKRRKNKSRKLN